jgi:8-oxo-dGTP pyrophosphatase MutT (NUDIX family)
LEGPAVTREALAALLEGHRGRTADAHEAAMLEDILAFVRSEPACAERTHAPGHLTGSAWITDPEGGQVLLTHHRKLDKWLQLGGHADGDLDLAAVALREAREESGLASVRPASPIPFDVDKHWIPPRRSDPGHWHYDVRFHVIADPAEPLVVSDESHDLAWVRVTEMASFNAEASMMRMAQKSLSGRRV